MLQARVPRGVEPVVPKDGQESVWEYPRPPRVESETRRVRVIVDGITLADSVRARRVLETAGPPVYYIPPDDVRMDLLVPSRHRTVCEWKGDATYLTFAGDRAVDSAAGQRREIANVAWRYETPNAGYESIAGYLAFYPGRVDEAWVGDERATPQPGRFYGGWVTSWIVGPFKGEPGTEGW